MNFKDYVDNLTKYVITTRGLNESNLSLQDLIDNFRKVFPYSKADNNVLSYKIEGKDTEDMICTGKVASSNSDAYTVSVKFHRNDTQKPFSIMNIGEVNCSCNAFRYNTAYPDIQNKVFHGQPKSNNMIPNTVRNPQKVPSVCKHLYSFLIYLYNKGIIRNN